MKSFLGAVALCIVCSSASRVAQPEPSKKFMDMLHAPKQAEEALHAKDAIPSHGLGLLSMKQGARTGEARQLAEIGQAESAVMSVLKGHPQLQRQEKNLLDQAEDLVLHASQHRLHESRHPAVLLHEEAHGRATQGQKAKVMSTATLKAQSQSALRNYGTHMSQFAKENRRLAREIAHAKVSVYEALKEAGASSSMEHNVENLLGKAKDMQQHLASAALRESKEALKEAKGFGLAQTAAHSSAKSVTAASLKARARLSLMKHSIKMTRLAKRNTKIDSEIARAKAAVAEALEKSGASGAKVENLVESELSKAKSLVKGLAASETREAKSAMRQAKSYGLVQAKAKAVTAASLEAQRRVQLRKYGARLSHMAKHNRHLTKEIAHAKSAVAEALKNAGASASLQQLVAADLNKAKLFSRRVSKIESQEAKAAMKEAKKPAALAQTSAGSHAESSAAFQAESRMVLQKYRRGMANEAKESANMVHGLEGARDSVAEALEQAGVRSSLEDSVDAALSKAEVFGRRLVNMQKREAKQ